MKRLLLIICFGIVMLQSIGLASAMDWDNVYNYDPETKTATIENWLGLGSDLAYITLTSPQNVVVARGEDRLVGEFNFTTTGDFQDTFKDIYLTDMKTGNSISRGRQFKYKQYTNVSVDDYETVCEDVVTGNGTIQNCTQVEVGSRWEIQMDWIPISNPTNTFYKGVTYEIGVFVDVEANDWGDWIPSIMGVEIEEWATWTESLNVDLISYYTFDDDAASTLLTDSVNINNGTATFNTQDLSVTGKINKAIDFERGDSDYVGFGTPTWSTLGDEFSFNFWFKQESNSGPYGVIGGNVNEWELHVRDGRLQLGQSGVGAANQHVITTTLGDWAMGTVIYNSSGVTYYINGSNYELVSYSPTLSAAAPYEIAAYASGANTFDGVLDELGVWNRSLTPSEVTQLWNGGSGITYTNVFAPTITILYPENITYNATVTQLNYTNSSNAVHCWFSTDGGATNSSPITCV